MILKFSFKEIIRSWKFSLFFILSFSLGLTGFFILESFKDSLQQQITLNSKNILTADYAISARRKLTDSETKTIRSSIPAEAQEQELYEFYAMLRAFDTSRLVLIKAIDVSYPFYGSLDLESGEQITAMSGHRLKNEVLISSELKTQMKLSVGDTIQLGKGQFVVSGVVLKDSSETFRSTTLSPRVFISLNDLKQTELIQFGSTFSYGLLYKFPENYNTEALTEAIYASIKDPAVRVETPGAASEDAGRQLNYLFDFLGLVAVVSLFMSSMGGAFLFRLYLNSKIRQIAIYRSLGLLAREVFLLYFSQIIILSTLTLIPSYLIALILNPIFGKFLSQVSTFQLAPQISLQTFLICFVMALLGSVLTSLHQLVQILKFKPSQLYSGEYKTTRASKKSYLIFIPSLVFFSSLSIIQAKSFQVGLSFAVVMMGVLVLLTVLAIGVLKIFEGSKYLKNWILKYSLLNMARQKVASISVFVSIGLGALLINLLPQLKHSLQNEFKVESKSKTPALFMFDIQGDQIDKFLEYLKSKNITPMAVSPLVRSRIIRVNNENYERKVDAQTFKTREEEREARSRNRGVNLSYRDEFSGSEEIIKGVPFSGVYDFASQSPFELSVETRYADRMGLKLNDKLVFDIQGVELEGRITSIRKVKWTTFQPNFFILVQPGVLNDAPKTFIVSTPQMSVDEKINIQNEITAKFTNVSVLDVGRVVDDTIRTSDQMSWSLELMSALVLIAGYIILFSIIRTHMEMRRYEINMIKVLGAPFLSVMAFVVNEYVVLTLAGAAIGSVLSLLVSYGLSYYIFEGVFTLDLSIILYTLISVGLISVVISVLASYKILKEKPSELIKSDVL